MVVARGSDCTGPASRRSTSLSEKAPELRNAFTSLAPGFAITLAQMVRESFGHVPVALAGPMVVVVEVQLVRATVGAEPRVHVREIDAAFGRHPPDGDQALVGGRIVLR